MASGNGERFAKFQKHTVDEKLDFLYIELNTISNRLDKLESKIGFTTALYGFLGGAIPVLILVGIKYIFGA